MLGVPWSLYANHFQITKLPGIALRKALVDTGYPIHICLWGYYKSSSCLLQLLVTFKKAVAGLMALELQVQNQ